MSSLKNLYALLSPLRLYALDRGSLIDSELHAYSAGFEMIQQAIGELKAAPHPQLATGQALDMHEQATGLPDRSGIPCETRRELILRRMAGPFPPTRAGTQEALAGCGLIGPSIEERPGGLFISAQGLAPGMSADDCWRLALKVLPAHLPAFIAAKSWDELEAFGKIWDELDGLNRSWVEIALIGIG